MKNCSTQLCRQSARRLQPTRQCGFSMVEVLISAVVLTVGLLGAVSMQARGLSANIDARLTSSAVVYAKEIAEIMRGNKDVSIKTSTSENPYLLDGAVSLPSATIDCQVTTCADPKVFATYQVSEWLDRVLTELPGAKVSICYDDTPYDASGMPRWTCSNSGGVAVVKIGWTRRTTDSGANGAAAFDRALTPTIVLPVIAGSTL